MQLHFLGSGDSQGVPRWFCNCVVCKEAREGAQNLRSRPSVLLKNSGKNILLDCGPEFRMQAARENILHINTLVITHAHNDHILGLGDVLDFVRHTKSDLQIYAPAKVMPQLQERFGYLFKSKFAKHFRTLPTSGLYLDGWRLRAFEVPHGFNGQAHALHFENNSQTWVYCPDSLMIPKNIQKRWLQNLDLLVLGTSFYKEHTPKETRSVYDVTEALQLTQALKPKRTIFTHLGHGINVLKDVLPAKHKFAFDGMKTKIV